MQSTWSGSWPLAFGQNHDIRVSWFAKYHKVLPTETKTMKTRNLGQKRGFVKTTRNHEDLGQNASKAMESGLVI